MPGPPTLPPETSNARDPFPQSFANTNNELREHASRLDREIDALLAERAVIQRGLDAISYPVLTLPVEITSNIFPSTLVPWDSPHYDPEAPHQTSLRLGQICREWRQIALATRELWSTLDLTVVAYPDSKTIGAYQELAQTFLSRAASLPLDISLLSGDSHSFRAMVDILVPYSANWAQIRFSSPGFKVVEDLQAIHHQLPKLTTLELVLDLFEFELPDNGSFGNMFNDVPLLRDVSLSGFGSHQAALPWSQLTSL
ncbi:hypothetical protein C8R46DRAFT_922511, partial [Mycena filopes]